MVIMFGNELPHALRGWKKEGQREAEEWPCAADLDVSLEHPSKNIRMPECGLAQNHS